MLTELHIENLGVIERLELVLGPGMTAVTGETGAGKTMIVEAIELLVGGRADATIVRPGAAEARVDGRFVTDDDELVLTQSGARRRSVPGLHRRSSDDGRVPSPRAAAGLVDLHGQHDHQSLLAGPTQRAALDRFGGVELAPVAAGTGAAHRDRRRAGGARRRRAGAGQGDRPAALPGRRADGGERSTIRTRTALLERLEDALADAAGHREAGAAAHDVLAADGGGRDALAGALAPDAVATPFGEVTDRLASLLADLDDVVAEVRDIGEAIEEDPARLAEVRARRQLLRDLRRKYGDSLDDVMRYGDEAARRLLELEGYEERAAAARRRAAGGRSTPSGGRRARSGAPGDGRRPGSATR